MVVSAFITQLTDIFNDISITDATTENLTDAVIAKMNELGIILHGHPDDMDQRIHDFFKYKQKKAPV